jgi:hypothetical protein
MLLQLRAYFDRRSSRAKGPCRPPGHKPAGEVKHGEVRVGPASPSGRAAGGKRFSHEWVRSTTQRRARKPASIAFASSPRARTWAVKPNSATFDREARERLPEQLVVVDVRAGDREPDRDALPLAEQAALRPLFGSVGRVWPQPLPARGDFVIARSAASDSHSTPLTES